MYHIEFFGVSDVTKTVTGNTNNIKNSVSDLDTILNRLNDIEKYSNQTLNKIDFLLDNIGEIVYKFFLNNITPFIFFILFIILSPLIINIFVLITNIFNIGSNIIKK